MLVSTVSFFFAGLLLPFAASKGAYIEYYPPSPGRFVHVHPVCSYPHSYSSIQLPPWWTEKCDGEDPKCDRRKLAAVDAEDCCRRCSEVKNCAYAVNGYHKDCWIYLNTQEVKGSETNEYCPLGVETAGWARDEKETFAFKTLDGYLMKEGFILGPCWKPPVLDEFEDVIEIESIPVDMDDDGKR